MIPFLFGFGIANADVAVAPEVEVQTFRLYEAEAFGTDFEVEAEGQTYLLGVDISLGNLLVTPKIGVANSTLEVAEMVELDNDLGLAAGLDIEYKILNILDCDLSVIGSYLYSNVEVDEVKILSSGTIIGNPLRNDLTCHNYEAGLKVTYTSLPVPIKPYVAVVYSDSQMNLETINLPFANLEIEAEAENNLGIRIGAEGSPLKNLMIKGEVKLIDQTAFILSGAYKF